MPEVAITTFPEHVDDAVGLPGCKWFGAERPAVAEFLRGPTGPIVIAEHMPEVAIRAFPEDIPGPRAAIDRSRGIQRVEASCELTGSAPTGTRCVPGIPDIRAAIAYPEHANGSVWFSNCLGGSAQWSEPQIFRRTPAGTRLIEDVPEVAISPFPEDIDDARAGGHHRRLRSHGRGPSKLHRAVPGGIDVVLVLESAVGPLEKGVDGAVGLRRRLGGSPRPTNGSRIRQAHRGAVAADGHAHVGTVSKRPIVRAVFMDGSGR